MNSALEEAVMATHGYNESLFCSATMDSITADDPDIVFALPPTPKIEVARARMDILISLPGGCEDFVFADVVAALAKFLQDYSFFHRSVYCQAQALMWTPVVCDPVAGSVAGSLGTVPAAWASSVKGLNQTGNAAGSSTCSLFVKSALSWYRFG
jgi:hypothetical protein